jgi:ATP-dependent DNA helicase PIF1
MYLSTKSNLIISNVLSTIYNMSLSEEQQRVIQLVKEGKNVFMTGPGGTGKSYLINHLLRDLGSSKVIQVCAMTGVAAELLECGAKTIHSWSGTGICTDQERAYQKVLSNRLAKKRWKQVDLLIIDEVSMMSVTHLKMLDYVARKIRKQDHPFGSLQILLSGDFHQLPPIGAKNTAVTHDSHKFCFQCDLWHALFPPTNVVSLTTFYRQKDPLFTKLLMQVRKGKISRNSDKILQSRLLSHVTPDKEPTLLSPIKHKVTFINDTHMARLTTEPITFTSQVVKNEEFYKHKEEELPVSYIRNELSRITHTMNAPPSVTLKVGAKVMCIANIDMISTNQIVNGSQGVVTDIIEGIPMVLFKNGVKRFVERHSWMSEDIRGLGIQQIPLILAWAITIHKSQGVTLDSCIVDAGSSIFEYGQAYVAFSRVKTLDGLYLKNYSPYSIKTNPVVQTYYNGLG